MFPRPLFSSVCNQFNWANLSQLGRYRSLHIAVRCCEAVSQPPKPIPPVKRISRADVNIQFARSSGAGGQNVNKVNTKVDMRFHLDSATWLDAEIKEALRRTEKKKINKEGELVITSQRTRSQADNVDDALEKLQEILDAAWKAVQPIPEDEDKKKKLAKQLEKGNNMRLESKKFQSDKKKDRRAKIEW